MAQQTGKSSRGNGEGNIRKKKDGRWEARITIGRNENGAQKMKYFSGKTRQEAAEKLSNYLNESKKGIYIEPNRYTVSTWLDDWYNNYVVNRVKTSTRQSYDTCIRVHIKPNLGFYKLSDLKSGTIQGFYNKLFANGKSRGRIRIVHNVLRAALQAAYLNDIIAKNPAGEKRVLLPQSTVKEPLKVFTPEEQKAIEKFCLKERLGTAILLDLYTGLRLGELVALTWEDIDFEKRTIKINKQLNRVRTFDKNASTRTVIKLNLYTKTSEDRVISVSQNVLNLLEIYREQEIENKIYETKDKDFVFGDEKGGYLDPIRLTNAYARILKCANVKYRKFHALRHTFATRALELNIPVKIVSKILGHANIGITLDTYSHVLPECQDEAMKTLADKLLAI